MNEFAKYLTVLFTAIAAFILLVLPGLLLVWVWAALRMLGLGVFWILLIILVILMLLSIPVFSSWRDFSRYFNGFC